MMIHRLLPVLLSLVILSGCAVKYGDRCVGDIQAIAQKNALSPHIFQTKNHKIFSLLGPKTISENLHVYIEGDGFAWASRRQISLDPTPIKPTGLTLAMADQAPVAKVYLGRPGHYIEDKRLGTSSWTFSRFSKEIIDSYGEIIDQLYTLYPGAKISLFGYSGGAMIALLTAAERYNTGQRDIQKVTTFAGVLDHEAWSTFHDATPLTFSLNSTAYIEALRHIPQTHYNGEEDTIAPLSVAQVYMQHFQDVSAIKLVKVSDVTHWSGWESYWKTESMR